MARIRTIKPEFWKHEDLCALPEATHILAAALLNYCDDYGFFNANPALIQAECSPLRVPSVSIPESLRSLQEIGYIDIGTCPKGRKYGKVINFSEHQRVSHPTASKISIIPITWESSGNPPEKIQNPPETFVPEQGTGNKEHGKESNGASAPQPKKPRTPTDDQFEALWCEYPKRAGSNPKDKARKALNARILEGESLEIIASGVSRYSQHCQMTGKINTEFIMQAVRFFGTSKEYLNEWEISNGQRNQHSRPSKSQSDEQALRDYHAELAAQEAALAGVASVIEPPPGISSGRQH